MPSFAFGTMQFGGRADARASEEMFGAARAAGIIHFDCAHLYNDGEAEQILGKLAAPERGALEIATKVGYGAGSAPDVIRAEFDLSQQRLNMDYVDILYLHRPDPKTPLEETFGALAELVNEGRVRAVGLSNFAAWQIMDALWRAKAFELPITIIQPMYSLVKRQAEVEILPLAEAQGLQVAGYSPLAAGLLSGKYSQGGAGRLTEDARYAARYGAGFMAEAAEGLAALAAELGEHPATLAVAWAAAHPAAPMPLISARTTKQLAPSLAAVSYKMSEALYARIAALSPTPPPATDRLEEA